MFVFLAFLGALLSLLCRGVLEKSVGEECLRRLLEKMLEKRVERKFCREVLQRGVVEKCWSSSQRAQKVPTTAKFFGFDGSISI